MWGGWSLTARRAASVALFRVVRLVFNICQTVVWQLNGTAKQLKRCYEPENYRQSAQVLDVLLCAKFCDNQSKSIEDFICTHNRFEDPRYVSDNEHVTLLMLDESRAWFAVTKDKGDENDF